MAWEIEFTPKAEKELGKLSRSIQLLISDYLDNRILPVANPRSLGKALKGDRAGLWRYRVDKYRIICRMEDQRLVVLVIQIAKRDKVYNQLSA